MITNLIDKLKMIFILEHVDQTGSANRLYSWLYWQFVEFILIGYSVLMITNLIDKLKMLFILEHVDQTGSANRLYSCLCWLFANENRLRIDWDQDQQFRGITRLISRTVLDQEAKMIWRTTRARMATNTCMLSSRLEVLQESCISTVFIFLDSCVNFAK